MKRLGLQIVNGALAGKRYEVKEGGLRLGRSSSNDVHVPDGELSRNHCLFETSGEYGVTVTDLASANGTLVNGRLIGGDAVHLRAGDVIEAGGLRIKVVGDAPPAVPPGGVDLGLGSANAAAPAGGGPVAKRRSPLANALWGVAVLIAAAAIYLALKAPPAGPDVAPVAEVDEKTRVIEVHYEKVEADLSGIFRYAMTISTGGVISVSLDDSKENRHPVIAPQRLDARALSELDELLSPEALGGLEGEYIGPEPEPQALSSWRLRVVYNNAVRSVRVVNTREPPDFRTIREKLETFSKNELGIHAIQYSRDRLISLAEDSISAGRTKWEDRDVQHGNLFGAVTAFKEAIFYLDTLDPKPDCVREARRGLEDAEKELDRRFRDQRFKADRAINLGQWDEAQKELAVLLEMVPDRADERNREASAKLIDVEKRMKGGR